MDSEVIETRARRPRGRRLLVILAGAAVVAATIGVSAVMASEPSGAGAGGAIPVDPAFTAFNTCMKDHGIDLGTPVVVSSDGTATGVTGGAIAISPSDLTPVTGTVTVTAGDVTALPVPIDDAKFKAANDACQPILEAAGIKSGSATISSGTLEAGSLQIGTGVGTGAGVIGAVTAGGDVTKVAADFTAYAACMRDNGVDMPDPKVDTAAGTVQLQMGSDPSSAAFQAASKTCGAKFPFAPLPVPAQP